MCDVGWAGPRSGVLEAGTRRTCAGRMAGMVDQALRDRVSRLSQADRLELIGQLWQSIEVDELEVTQAERDLLDDRLADLRNDPDAGRSWGEVEAELRSRFR